MSVKGRRGAEAEGAPRKIIFASIGYFELPLWVFPRARDKNFH